jgi:hypothetical protein
MDRIGIAHGEISWRQMRIVQRYVHQRRQLRQDWHIAPLATARDFAPALSCEA